MIKSRLFMGLLLGALAVLFAPASRAQSNCQTPGYVNGNGVAINCNVIAVGSSGIYSSAAIAAISGDPQRGNGPLCGSNFWTTGTGIGRDPRKTIPGTPLNDETATAWIAWDDNTNPTIICVYLATDSLVGQRLFFSQGLGASGPNNNGTFLLTSGTTSPGACGAAGANKVAFVWDTATTGLPVAVYNALEGTTGTTCPTPAFPVHFTTASTDVDPADALFVGNQRVLSPDTTSSAGFPADGKTSLGYGGSSGSTGVNCAGPSIASAFSGGTANGVCYTYVGGTPDPISGTAIPYSQIVTEGALALLPIINITHSTASSGGFGDLFTNHGFNNVHSADIAAGYAFSSYGMAALTRDLYRGPGASSLGVAPAHYLAREPQSGTYTTFEWQVLRNKETALLGGGLSQETNVCGASQLAHGCPYTTPAANPANCPALVAGTFPNTSSCSNYMSWGIAGDNALKTRVIGNGEMVSVSNTNVSGTCGGFPAFPCITDTFGYGFWSLGTYGGKNNLRYLQLDGVDALYPNWAAASGGNNGVGPLVNATQGTSATPGAPPADGCSGYFNGNGGTITTFSCSASWPYPTFANIVTGTYRAWTFNRVMWFVSGSGGTLKPSWTTLNAPAFWLSAADQTAPVIAGHGVIPDFLPFGYCANAAACPEATAPTLTYPMEAFRAHYADPTWGIGVPNNGIIASGFGGVENGGDVAGMPISVQAEADSIGFFGDSFLTWVQ